MIQEVAKARVALREQVRMTSELEIASSIQKSLLPPEPKHPEFEFAGKMWPEDEVGGDFYDVLTRKNTGELWLIIGDVSSHGLSAGLVMLMAQSAFASQFEANPRAKLDDAYRAVNRLLCSNINERLKDNKYVTSQVYAYRGNGMFECTGGHEWPVVYRAKTSACETPEALGPWLGIMHELNEVPVSKLELQPGDILCLYTDGLTEARNADGELFDMVRLCAALQKAASTHADLGQVANAVFEQVQQFAEGREDDWTLLLTRRK